MSKPRQPAPSANKQAWIRWAVSTGMDPFVAEDMTRLELIEATSAPEPPVTPTTVLEATRTELDSLHPPAALAAAALALAKDLDEEGSVQARVLLARELRITMTQARALRSVTAPARGSGEPTPPSRIDEVRQRREERKVSGG